MSQQTADSKTHMLLFIICGLSTLIAYLVALLVQLPSLRMSYLVFMSFGPLFCVSVFALRVILKQELPSITLDVATLLLVVAGATNTLMAAMQGSLFIYFNGLPHGDAVVETAHTAWEMGYHSGNALQLGADMAWDVFLFSGFIILGTAVLRHPRFGFWFGWSAIIIGSAGLVLNSLTFPIPPAEDQLIDIGPFVGMWFAAVVVRVLFWLRATGE